MADYPSRSIHSIASLSKSLSFSLFLLFFLFPGSKRYQVGTLDLIQSRVPTWYHSLFVGSILIYQVIYRQRFEERDFEREAIE